MATDLEKAALDGDAEAQFELGNHFTSKSASKRKEPSDDRRAFAWYRKAAKLGHTNAQYRVALAYTDGVGVRVDYVQAVHWFQRAANQGNAWAQFRLGQCYKNGEGVAVNLETAITWFQKAADQEHEKSRAALESVKRALLPKDKPKPAPQILPEIKQTPIALLTDTILNLKECIEVDLQWDFDSRPCSMLTKTARRFASIIQISSGGETADGKDVMEVMMLALPKGSHIKISAAGSDAPSAMQALKDVLTQTGYGAMEGDNVQTLPPIIQVGQSLPTIEVQEPTDADAQFRLGCCYTGWGKKELNLAEAAKWFRRAAEQGHADAQFCLGNYYSDMPSRISVAPDVENDKKEATDWYYKAASQGHSHAQYRVALAYAYGVGVQVDRLQAATWFEKAANQGNIRAEYELGYCYENGLGVEKDDAVAIKWYRKVVAKEGHYHLANRAEIALSNLERSNNKCSLGAVLKPNEEPKTHHAKARPDSRTTKSNGHTSDFELGVIRYVKNIFSNIISCIQILLGFILFLFICYLVTRFLGSFGLTDLVHPN